MDVIHLDSVISEQERVYYTYNEFGYLASQKTYRLEDGNIWTIQTDERDSFLSEYTFDEQNRCVDYSRYKYTPNETKGVKVEQITVAYFNDMRCEKYYYMDEEVSVLALEEEITYKPNRAAIKEAIKAGREVSGCQLIENLNIQIN